jgi:aspartyl-tRNA(Asn)/glutamyl-tRNA(Gln) amidotransferase subunit B
VTLSQRTKEFAHDYRYFPEPDLPPLVVTRDIVGEIQVQMPELPRARRDRFAAAFGLGASEADLLTDERNVADYYEQAVANAGGHFREVANWVLGDVFALAKTRGGFERLTLAPEALAEIVGMVSSGDINAQAGKDVLVIAEDTGRSPHDIVDERGLRQVSDESKIRDIVLEVVTANQAAVADYHNGKKAALGFLLGQIMKAMRGTGNPGIARNILTQVLDNQES